MQQKISIASPRGVLAGQFNRIEPPPPQRYQIKKLPDEDKLTNRIINLIAQYGRYGTPRITAMLHREGWKVNHKRVERIVAKTRA